MPIKERRKDYLSFESLKNDIEYIKSSIVDVKDRDNASDKKFDDHVLEDQKYHRKVDKLIWAGCGMILAALYIKEGLDGLVKAAFAAIGG